MSRRLLLNPLRTFLGPRPAIQAWRSARCFATEVAPVSSSAPLPPTPISETTTPISAVPSGTLADSITSGLAELSVVEGRQEETKDALKPKRGKVGVVVSAGKMEKTVKVRIPGQKWNTHLRKYFREDTNHLVHDPKSSLNVGDVISLSPHRAAKHVHHVVQEILVPFGAPITERPAVPSERDRRIVYEKKRRLKAHRRNLRRAANEGDEHSIKKLESLGVPLDPRQSAQTGAGKKGAQKARPLSKKARA